MRRTSSARSALGLVLGAAAVGVALSVSLMCMVLFYFALQWVGDGADGQCVEVFVDGSSSTPLSTSIQSTLLPPKVDCGIIDVEGTEHVFNLFDGTLLFYGSGVLGLLLGVAATIFVRISREPANCDHPTNSMSDRSSQ